MNIRWITTTIGTAPADEIRNISGVEVIDVRDLVDKAGNRSDAVREKIMLGTRHLAEGRRILICCDYGISRSNAIAAGILAIHSQMSFDSAVRFVQEATGEADIKLEPLSVVRNAIEGNAARSKNADKRTVLITGARGFVGSATCRQLEGEFKVVPMSHDQVDLEKGSTQLSLLVGEHNVDCIIHLANPRVYTSSVALGTTLSMLRNVLDVCATRDISLIYPSSWEIFSGYTGSLLADESVPAFPRGPYGETKYLTELLIDHWRRTTDLRCAVLRSSPVYGPGSDRPKFLYNFFGKVKASSPIFTHRYLNGVPMLDLLHIDDLVDAIVRVFRQSFVGNLNVGTGIATSTHTIAEMIKAETGSSSPVSQLTIESTTASIAMNYQKARQLLGWEPKILLQDGLRRVFAENFHEGSHV